MKSEKPTVSNIDYLSETPFVIGNNALKSEYWNNSKPIGDQVIDLETYKRNPLASNIEYFDKYWWREELPKNWYKIDDVGFSSKRQMDLLLDSRDVKKWADQTGQDLLGFGLEYLSQGTVFPFEYRVENGELVDKKYGNKKMKDTVDKRERNGAVMESLLKMQSHLVDGNEGATAIMISPPGDTGLTMDDGSRIIYTQTMVFYMEKRGDKILGTTLRVDLNLPRAQELLEKLTGEKLTSNDMSPEDCTRKPVLLDGESGKSKLSALALAETVQVLQGSKFSYENKTWENTKNDIGRREELYYFDEITNVIIKDFKDYITSNNLTNEQIQKALGATFLRISKHLLVDKPISDRKTQQKSYDFDYGYQNQVTMGAVINKVRLLPGCMGGGGKVTSVESIIQIPGQVDNNWNDKTKRKFDQPGPCRICGSESSCGPCKICRSCNDKMDMAELTAQAA